MLTRDEAALIAGAINVLRPDWGIPGLLTILGDERIRLRRTYRTTALAMTALAVDPACRKPTRIFESGPWWEAAAPYAPVVELYRRPTGRDCQVCSQSESECRRRPGGHDFDPRPQEPAPPPADLFTTTPPPATPATRED